MGANDKIVMGVMGLGGRGTYLAEKFAERPDVEIAYLCDPNTRRFARAREAVEEAQDRSPKMVQDFRRVLDDKNVDVLINATPDHWHAMASILACQAGKDVFVEKPLAHNIWEGRKMVEAARKYQRVIQVGMQSRSAPYAHKARDYIRAGKLGDVYLVRVYNMMQHPKQREAPDGPVPDGFDYELWCGPAPNSPYNHSPRLNQFETVAAPSPATPSTSSTWSVSGRRPAISPFCKPASARFGRKGHADTQMAMFEYEGLTMTLDASLWTPYEEDHRALVTDRFPASVLQHEGQVLGTEGFMVFGRRGGGGRLRRQLRTCPLEFGRQGDKRTRTTSSFAFAPKEVASDVEIGHTVRAAVPHRHISYRRQPTPAIRLEDGIIHQLRRGQPVSRCGTAPAGPRKRRGPVPRIVRCRCDACRLLCLQAHWPPTHGAVQVSTPNGQPSIAVSTS